MARGTGYSSALLNQVSYLLWAIRGRRNEITWLGAQADLRCA